MQALKAGTDQDSTTQSRQEETTLRQAVHERKREVLLGLRLAGTVDDVEEQRLTGVEDID